MSRKLLVLLALCAIGAIVAYRASGFTFNWGLFVQSLKEVRISWLIGSVLLTFATYWLRAIRWKVLLSPLKTLSIGPLFAITTVGFAAIYALGRAGELARPIFLARREDIPMTGSIATVVVERVLDMILIASLFGVALLAVEVPPGTESTLGRLKKAAWLISAGAAGALATLMIIRTNSRRIVELIPFRRVASWIDSFAQGLAFLQNARTFFVVILQSAMLWIVIALQFWFLLRGMNFDFSLGASTLVMVAAGIGSLAQIPGVGGGFQFAYIACMTTLFQVPTERATATALIAWVISYGPTVAGAAIYMVVQGISVKELKNTLRKPETV
jgi:uncharacterized protein (TIRG00374 family)